MEIVKLFMHNFNLGVTEDQARKIIEYRKKVPDFNDFTTR